VLSCDCLSECFFNLGGSHLHQSNKLHQGHRVRFGKMLLHRGYNDNAFAFSVVIVCDVLVWVSHTASHAFLVLTSL
jgi:hypothetical protein